MKNIKRKKRLTSCLRSLISTIVISSMATAFAVEESSECNRLYSKAGRKEYHPLITIPVFDPISNHLNKDLNVFEGRFTLINAEKDFVINVRNKEQFNFVKQIKYIDKLKADCYAKYDWQTDTFEIPYVYLRSVVVLPMEDSLNEASLNL